MTKYYVFPKPCKYILSLVNQHDMMSKHTDAFEIICNDSKGFIKLVNFNGYYGLHENLYEPIEIPKKIFDTLSNGQLLTYKELSYIDDIKACDLNNLPDDKFRVLDFKQDYSILIVSDQADIPPIEGYITVYTDYTAAIHSAWHNYFKSDDLPIR